MKSSLLSYPGDAVLARLLAHARAGQSVAAVKDLIAGVLAAPEGFDPEGWIALVVPDAAPELAGALKGLKGAMAAQVNDGLEAGPPAPAWRLKALRAELAHQGLDGFVVPRADEHQGEYVPRNGNRLLWLTGFSGSAGVAVALAEKAAIFVDGRYTLQVEDQVRTDDWERHHVSDSPPTAWIAANLGGGRLGYDPWLHTPAGVRRLEAACAKAGGLLVPVEPNPLDTVWTNRSPAPLAPVIPRRWNRPDARPKTRSARFAPCWPPRVRPRRCCRIRHRWPGCSTSAAATCPTRRWRWPSPSSRPTDGSVSMATGASSARRWRATSRPT